jgi:hypothetical protein
MLKESYIQSIYSTKARQPHNALTLDTKDKEILSREQSLANPLRFSLLRNLRSASKESVSADGPRLMTINVQRDNIAKKRRAKRNTSWTGVRRLKQVAAREELS